MSPYNYLDDFRDLILESRYANPKTIVVKFRQGLNPVIADAVATMAARRLDDLDPEAWYEAAIQIDQNQAANAAFRSAHQPPFQPKPTTTRFAQIPQAPFTNHRTSLIRQSQHPPVKTSRLGSLMLSQLPATRYPWMSMPSTFTSLTGIW
jgi:hypothetical protein